MLINLSMEILDQKSITAVPEYGTFRFFFLLSKISELEEKNAYSRDYLWLLVSKKNGHCGLLKMAGLPH